MIKLKNILLLLLTIIPFNNFAQKTFGGYNNVLTGIALDSESVLYKDEKMPNGFFEFVLITSEKQIIITNNQLDKRIKFSFTSKGEINDRMVFSNEIEKTVFVINFSDGNIGYYDLNSEEIILKAKIDILMTTALMKQIKKTTN